MIGPCSLGEGTTDLAIQVLRLPKILWIVLTMLPSIMVLLHTKGDLSQLPSEVSCPYLCSALSQS
jgi:hypothetical protein